nr:MAG TPA: hypothetical protein [Caudoviricetes sp.]
MLSNFIVGSLALILEGSSNESCSLINVIAVSPRFVF